MGVRFDANADYRVRTASVPDRTGFSVSCWVKLKSDRNTVCGAVAGASATNSFAGILTLSDGTTMLAYAQEGASACAAFGPNMNVDQWYFFGATFFQNGGTYEVELYTGVEGISTLSKTTGSAVMTLSAFTDLEVGRCGLDNTRWLDGEMAALKIWDTVLTETEFQNEMYMFRASKLDSIFGYYLGLDPITIDLDYSENLYNLSQGDTTDPDEAGNPSISYQTGGRKYPLEVLIARQGYELPIARGNSETGEVLGENNPASLMESVIAGVSLTVVAPTSERRRVLFNRNLSNLRSLDPSIAFEATISALQELQRAVDQIYEYSFSSQELTDDGLPFHGSLSEITNGQFIEIFTPNSNSVIAVQHGLSRAPQGAIPIYWEGDTLLEPIIVARDLIGLQVPGASSNLVYFFAGPNVSADQRFIFLLF